MARRSVRDNTNVYRFKTTHKGVYIGKDDYVQGKRGAMNERLKGQPFEEVKLHGLYNNRIAFSGWVPNDGTFKIERQQLIAQYDEVDQDSFLMWYTIETKYYEEGERVDA